MTTKVDELIERLRRVPSLILEQAKANISEAADTVAAQAAEIARLREALSFYAKPEVYRPSPHGLAFDDRDLSFCARNALSPREDG
jgi:hypothetical protein